MQKFVTCVTWNDVFQLDCEQVEEFVQLDPSFKRMGWLLSLP